MVWPLFNLLVSEPVLRLDSCGAELTFIAVRHGFGKHILMLRPEDIVPFTKVSLRCEPVPHIVTRNLSLTPHTRQYIFSEDEYYLISPLTRIIYYQNRHC